MKYGKYIYEDLRNGRNCRTAIEREGPGLLPVLRRGYTFF